jgi:hypothetical protein
MTRVIRFSDRSSRRHQNLSRITRLERKEDVMERRHFLKLAFGYVAGATALAASASAAPLPPIPAGPDLVPPRGESAQPAVTTQDDADRLKPEQVRWHRRHWGWRRRRHWGWHRRRWHHRRRYWRRRYW